MSKGHLHKCERCHQAFGCAGEMTRNHDGWPEVACELFHVTGGAFRQCEACAMTTWCDHCGAHPAKVEIDGERLCLTCAEANAAQQATA